MVDGEIGQCARGDPSTVTDLHAGVDGISYGAWLRFLDQNYLGGCVSPVTAPLRSAYF